MSISPHNFTHNSIFQCYYSQVYSSSSHVLFQPFLLFDSLKLWSMRIYCLKWENVRIMCEMVRTMLCHCVLYMRKWREYQESRKNRHQIIERANIFVSIVEWKLLLFMLFFLCSKRTKAEERTKGKKNENENTNKSEYFML